MRAQCVMCVSFVVVYDIILYIYLFIVVTEYKCIYIDIPLFVMIGIYYDMIYS